MKLDELLARILPLLLLGLALLAFGGILSLAARPANAAVAPSTIGKQPPIPRPRAAAPRGAIATAELPSASGKIIGPVLIGPPICRLEVTQTRYRDGDTVRASLHLSNPTPTAAQVEMKLWFSAPGEAPLSLADPTDAGKTLELPGMLNRDSGNLRLFAVDPSTPRGTYEMSCRLINPTTGALLSEDLNAFQVY